MDPQLKLVSRAGEMFPFGTAYKLSNVSLALQAAVDLYNEISDGSRQHEGLMGILELVKAQVHQMHENFTNTESASQAAA
jgi:hypothetical protein